MIPSYSLLARAETPAQGQQLSTRPKMTQLALLEIHWCCGFDQSWHFHHRWLNNLDDPSIVLWPPWTRLLTWNYGKTYVFFAAFVVVRRRAPNSTRVGDEEKKNDNAHDADNGTWQYKRHSPVCFNVAARYERAQDVSNWSMGVPNSKDKACWWRDDESKKR